MLKTIIIMTKSYKPGGFCVSGIDFENGEWIRVVSDRVNNGISSDDLTYQNGKEAEVLDVVEITLSRYEPLYYQPENYVNNDSFFWNFINKVEINDVLTLHPFENDIEELIYYNTQYNISESFIKNIDLKAAYSLTLIKVSNPIVNVKTWRNGKKSITLEFIYNHNKYQFFRITEGSNHFFLNHNDGKYIQEGEFSLVISLGEPYSSSHQPTSKHYKLIASIIPL